MTAQIIGNFLTAWRQTTGVEIHFEPPSATSQYPYSFKLIYEGESQGLLSLAELPAGMSSTQAQALLETCGSLLAAALGERQTANRLAEEVLEAWSRLTFAYRLSETLTQSENTAMVLETISAFTRDTFQVEQVFIAQRTPQGDRCYCANNDMKQADASIFLDRLITQEVKFEATLANTPQEYQILFPKSVPLNSFLGIPLPTRIGPPSIIGLINHLDGSLFSAGDRRLLESAAEQVATLIDTVISNEQRTVNARLNHEIEIASFFQSSLLPNKMPALEGYECAAITVPVARVSGDFYDVIEDENGDLGFMVIDVAGKGVPAAMLTSMIRSTIRSQFRNSHHAGTVLSTTNQILYEDMSRIDSFATAFLGILIPKTRHFRYIGAGHTATLWWQGESSNVIQLPSIALPLGILEKIDSFQQTISLNSGDVIIIYSDGITEAENAEGKVFGEQGLADVLFAVHAAPVEKILQAILDGVNIHRGRQPINDDLTAIIIKVNEIEIAQTYRAFILPATISALQQIETILASAWGTLATDSQYETWRYEVNLAIVELLTNIVRHAYDYNETCRIQGLFTLHVDRFTADVVDSGASFEGEINSQEDISLEDPPEGGFGLHIISSVMDIIKYRRIEPSRNHWHLEKKLISRRG